MQDSAMMSHKINLKLCRLCGKEKQESTDLFADKIKGTVLMSIIKKYFSKVINISNSDTHSKHICNDCEQTIYTFDEFCLMIANVQKQLSAPSLENKFTENMLCQLKGNDTISKTVSDKQETRKIVCPICAKSFRCDAHLIRHKRIHTGQRPFVCNICKMSFNQHEILMKHIPRHDEQKKFFCSCCPQTFAHKMSLMSHAMNCHMDLDNIRDFQMQHKSFICSECGKQFVTKYKLRRHSRCHTGERPYCCTFCMKTFSQTGNLKVHQVKYHQIPKSMVEIREQIQYNNQIVDCDVPTTLNNFNAVNMSETELQNTLNQTINPAGQTDSCITKIYENPLYIDDEIETILDRDLGELERSKYSTNLQDKVPHCLKQPETPELLRSLLYDDE